MDRSHSDISKNQKRTLSAQWGESEHITSRLAWPIYIVAGQVALLTATFGFLGAVRQRGQIPLGVGAAQFFTENPQVKNYLFTFFANFMALLSSYLFTQAIRHAILVSLTRPVRLSTLGYGILLSKRTLIVNRHFQWGESLSGHRHRNNTPCTHRWSSLFTPNPITVEIRMEGTELDMASQSFQEQFSMWWETSLKGLIESPILATIDESGAANANYLVGYPSTLNFGGRSHLASTRGIMPTQFVIDGESTAGKNSFNTTLFTRNTDPIPPTGNVSIVMYHQGLTANVSCSNVTLDATTTPPLLRSSQTLSNSDTFWTTTTVCGDGTNATAQATTQTSDTVFMVGCVGTDTKNRQTFYTIIDGNGGNMISSYNTLVDVTTVVDESSEPLPAGQMGMAAYHALESGVIYGQNSKRNFAGDVVTAILVDQTLEHGEGAVALGTLLESYILGVVEFSATAMKTFLTGPNQTLRNPPPDMSRTINGTAFVTTLGWEYRTATAVVLIPVILFGAMTILIVVVAQFYNRGIPLSSARFNPNDPWSLMAASAAGGMGGVFQGVEEDQIEQGWRNRVVLTKVDGRDGFMHVERQQDYS
ncbi:hypothetical protein MKEN_00414600 [Mycena kentingensis (nom. inval.)]|nr:hypothetical protein MKEN_00414600 [Mycena kentingensis (nom. inval.)]